MHVFKVHHRREVHGGVHFLEERFRDRRDVGWVLEVKEDKNAALAVLGADVDRLLWELARFGSQLDPDPDPREPGNLRTVALPLRLILESVPNRPNLVARLLIDDDSFTIISTPDEIEVHYQDTTREPDLVARADYEGFLEAGEGRISFDEFTTRHLEIIDGTDHADAFLTLMGAAMSRGE